MRDNGDPLDTLKPQPGQYDSYHPKFHPLPGVWAQEQLAGKTSTQEGRQSPSRSKSGTEIQHAIAAEKRQHEYWQRWQGVSPGKAEYENPRAWQNTLLPTAKYGTDGR